MDKNTIDTKEITIGVVGLGLMGCSICTCLLMAGHKVIAVAPIPDDLVHAEKRIKEHLRRSKEEKLIEVKGKSIEILNEESLLKISQFG